MTPFTMVRNEFLNQDIQGFYHTDFGGINLPNNPNFLYKLKNDPHHNWTTYQLKQAQQELLAILLIDLPSISEQINNELLTVCVIPRSKAEENYQNSQLLFKTTVQTAITQLGNKLEDGTGYIKRITNTKTTHLRKPIEGFLNDGPEPYRGISKDTCQLSQEINGQDLLLIDDIYTKSINIDEDMVQALFNTGAKSVTFYAIGNTLYNHH